MKLKIGLTGPTGAGKSTVSQVAESMGFQVIDCDKVARKATEKGSIGLLKLAAVFGDDILNSDDTLNRKVLADIAATDAVAFTKLVESAKKALAK